MQTCVWVRQQRPTSALWTSRATEAWPGVVSAGDAPAPTLGWLDRKGGQYKCQEERGESERCGWDLSLVIPRLVKRTPLQPRPPAPAGSSAPRCMPSRTGELCPHRHSPLASTVALLTTDEGRGTQVPVHKHVDGQLWHVHCEKERGMDAHRQSQQHHNWGEKPALKTEYVWFPWWLRR